MIESVPQNWRCLGRILEPKPHGTWWCSHAAYPTALKRLDGRVTIFFSARDSSNRSHLASVDLFLDGERFEASESIRGPLFEPGPRGSFDADGVTVTSILRDEGRLLAYYLGWTIGASVPFTNFIGLAIGDEHGLAFERSSPVPIIGRSVQNPLTIGYPWVLRRTGGFRMWFGTHTNWGPSGLEMTHVLKQARSVDGLHWEQDDRVVLPLNSDASDPSEFAISRPTVVLEPDGSLSMWYARRRPHYEIGFASSKDGEVWIRQDDIVRFTGKRGNWDDTERTYPCVFDYGNRRYMLYNGNGYGKTGFGIAVLEA